jgi:Tol biopolymer transport system component
MALESRTPQQIDWIRAELERVLASPAFTRSERQQRLLRFLVEEELAGRSADIKESVIGVEVFDRPRDFDPKTDPVVRVSAGRLRERLREFYEQRGNGESCRIEIPKGGYVPVFRVKGSPPQAAPAVSVPMSGPKPVGGWKWLAVAAAVVCGLAAVTMRAPTGHPAPASHFVALTPATAFSSAPSLSRDGRVAAYVSDGGGRTGIWVKNTAAGPATELVKDIGPVEWVDVSPDSAWVAFNTQGQDGGVFIVPTLGGTPRKLAANGRRPRFSPDGSRIAFLRRTVTIVSVGGGSEESVATKPELSHTGFFAWQPDGSHLLVSAFPKEAKPDDADWWVVPASGGEAIKTGAVPKLSRLVEDPSRKTPLLHDWWGEWVYFAAAVRNNGSNIWRARLDDQSYQLAGKPEPVTQGAAVQYNNPRVGAGKMVFSAATTNVNAWMAPLSPSGTADIGKAQRISDRNCVDTEGSFSSDGAKYANCCEGAGAWEVFVRDLNTGKDSIVISDSKPVHMIRLSGDGLSLFYAMVRNGKTSYFRIGLNGGAAETICQDCRVFSFSADGARMITNEREGGAVLHDRTTGSTVALWKARRRGQVRLSPDGRLVLWRDEERPGSARIVVAPWQVGTGVDDTQAAVVAEGDASIDYPRWSADGGVVYYSSAEDDQPRVWARRLGNTGRPQGDRFVAFEFPRRSRAVWHLGFAVIRDRIAYRLSDSTKLIWLAELTP